ncbi:MAG: glycosyltransferase involved in cell wall biosynthesis [Rhodothermales bacterium]|jgi:glycosyltransferase involved in cell wall biosynthesis
MISSTRILIYAEHFRLAHAGAENDLVVLARALASRGHDVHVLSDTSDPIEGITLHQGLENADAVRSQVEPVVTLDWGFFHRADIHRVGGAVHQAFLPQSRQAYGPVARMLKSASQSLSGKHRRQIAKEAQILSNPDARYLPISQLVAKQLRDAGVNQERIHTLYNGVDADRFHPDHTPAERQSKRAALGIPEDAVVFLFIAHNLRLKNLALLKRVFDRLHGTNPKMRLLVIGKRQPPFTAPYLIYAGPSHQVEEFFMSSDALLHSTYYDAFGNVVLEAMSAGLPVVVTPCAGASELIVDGSSGVVVPVQNSPVDTDRWAAAVAELAENPARRHALGNAARQTAKQHALSDFLDEFEQIIIDVSANDYQRFQCRN